MSKLPMNPMMVGEKKKTALILAFSLGEKESSAVPARRLNAAATNPARVFSSLLGAYFPLTEEGRGENSPKFSHLELLDHSQT
jgi:hypothetical protein